MNDDAESHHKYLVNLFCVMQCVGITREGNVFGVSVTIGIVTDGGRGVTKNCSVIYGWPLCINSKQLHTGNQTT